MATQKRNGRKRNATRQIRCRSGYRRDKNTGFCRRIKPSTRRRKRCPAGSRRVSGRCRSNPVRNCPPGYSRVRGRCLPQRCPTDTYNQCMYPDYSTVPYVLGQRCPDGSTRVCMQAQQLLDTIVDKNNAIEILNAEKIEAPNVQAGVALDDMIKELTVDALIAKKEIDVLAAAAPAVPNAQLDAIVQQADVAIQPAAAAAAAAAAAVQVPKAPSVLQTVAAKIRQAAASLPNMKIDANRKATAAEVVNILAQNPTLTPHEVQIIAQNPEVTAAVVEALVDDNQVMTSNKVATMSKKPEVIQDALTLLRQPQTHRMITPMNRLNNNNNPKAQSHIFSSIMQPMKNGVPDRFTMKKRSYRPPAPNEEIPRYLFRTPARSPNEEIPPYMFQSRKKTKAVILPGSPNEEIPPYLYKTPARSPNEEIPRYLFRTPANEEIPPHLFRTPARLPNEEIPRYLFRTPARSPNEEIPPYMFPSPVLSPQMQMQMQMQAPPVSLRSPRLPSPSNLFPSPVLSPQMQAPPSNVFRTPLMQIQRPSNLPTSTNLLAPDSLTRIALSQQMQAPPSNVFRTPLMQQIQRPSNLPTSTNLLAPDSLTRVALSPDPIFVTTGTDSTVSTLANTRQSSVASADTEEATPQSFVQMLSSNISTAWNNVVNPGLDLNRGTRRANLPLRERSTRDRRPPNRLNF